MVVRRYTHTVQYGNSHKQTVVNLTSSTNITAYHFSNVWELGSVKHKVNHSSGPGRLNIHCPNLQNQQSKSTHSEHVKEYTQSSSTEGAVDSSGVEKHSCIHTT